MNSRLISLKQSTGSPPNGAGFRLPAKGGCASSPALSPQTAKAVSPGISVNHNFAASLFNWTLGLSFESSIHHDCLGADFYGDSLEQMVVSKMMTGLARGAACGVSCDYDRISE